MGKVVIPGFRKIEVSSSGEGGTTNYNDLTNKPSINNVPLVGNLNTANLKLTDATLTEEGVPAEAKTVGTKLEAQSTSLTALSEQLGNHTVKSDVPENAVFTDTVYNDTEVKERIEELNSNLHEFGVKNLFNGELYNGYVDSHTGEIGYYVKTLCNQNILPCEPNKKMVLDFESNKATCELKLAFYDGSSFISIFEAQTSSNTISATAPANANGFRFQITAVDDSISTSDVYNVVCYQGYLAKELGNINESLGDLAYGTDSGNKNICPIPDYTDVQDSMKTLTSPITLPAGTYTLSWMQNGNPSTSTRNTPFYYANGKNVFQSGVENRNKSSGRYSWTFTLSSETYIVIGYWAHTLSSSTTYTNFMLESGSVVTDYKPYISSNAKLTKTVTKLKNDLDKLNSLPIGSIIQIESAKDNIETTEQKYGWQYLGTSNIECNDGAVMLLVTNVYRKNN